MSINSDMNQAIIDLDTAVQRHGGLLSPKGGKHHKKRTHKAERQEAKKGEE